MRLFTKTKKKIKTLAPDKQERANKLLEKIIFMDAQLSELQEVIEEKGWTEEYQNGANQFGIKKSTEGDVYNTLIKNYTTAMKNLNDMLPEGGDEQDELEQFLAKA